MRSILIIKRRKEPWRTGLDRYRVAFPGSDCIDADRGGSRWIGTGRSVETTLRMPVDATGESHHQFVASNIRILIN